MSPAQGKLPAASAAKWRESAARHQQIARVAYRRWLARGCPAGTALRDWLDAERDYDSVIGSTPPRWTNGRPGSPEVMPGLPKGRGGGEAAEESDFADFLENAIVPLHWVAADGTILWANRAELELLGYPREEYVGRHIAEFHVDSEVIKDMLARLARGESLRDRDARLRRKDGTIRDVLISSNVLWRDGAFVHTRCFTADVSERKRLEGTLRASERRLAAEHAVARILAGGDPFADAGAAILEALGRHMGWDVGAIWMLDPDGAELRCISFWSRPGGGGAPLFEAQSRSMTQVRGVGLPGRVWETGKPVCITDPSRDPNFPRWATALEEGLRSAIGFPLGDRGRFFGVIEFLSRESYGPNPELLEMLWHLGTQIGQAVERRRAAEALHRRDGELEIAQAIQRRLLPATAPVLPGYAIAAASRPAQETGGDYYDFLRLPGGAVGIAVGDASGHGVGAAIVIAETRAYLKAFAVIEAEPGRLLTRVNRAVAEDLGDGFVTLFVARLDPATATLTYSSAGHWPGYVLGSDGEVKSKLHSTGLPLGLDPGAEFQTPPAVRLEPGDLVLLLTDGLMEAMSPEGELFGIDRVLDAVRGHGQTTPEALLAGLLARVDEFDGGRISDDRTVVLVEVLPTA